MLKCLLSLLINSYGGLGITRASLVSAICDKTGEDSADSVIKVKRLINEVGPDFCMITDWPFTRSDLSFDITTAAHTYSGASYLPATHKKVLTAYLIQSGDTTKYPLTEVGLGEKAAWINPNDNQGRPDEFCITRIESGYWEIQFNRLPDQTYTVYFELELQWTDLTSDSSETVITKPYYTAFAHYCSMARAVQQPDIELFTLLDRQWFDPNNPQKGILGRILKSLKKPAGQKSVIVNENYIAPFGRTTGDYDKGVDYC